MKQGDEKKKEKNSDSKNGIHNRFEIYLYPVPRVFILMREFQQCVARYFHSRKSPGKVDFFKILREPVLRSLLSGV